jgi:hypothetical protein
MNTPMRIVHELTLGIVEKEDDHTRWLPVGGPSVDASFDVHRDASYSFDHS